MKKLVRNLLTFPILYGDFTAGGLFLMETKIRKINYGAITTHRLKICAMHACAISYSAP